MTPEVPGAGGGFDARVTAELEPEFRVIRKLGEGAMASVYLAKDVALDQLRAIKVLAPDKAADRTARRRFEREAKSAARITHDNVTTVVRVGALSDETPFLVMEYVDGRNLEDILAGGGPLPQDEAREVIRELAEALVAAHEEGITHRDLKPANILRESATGQVRLTDFGVAAVRDMQGTDTTRLTQQGQLLGELEYVAPEHLMGEELTELADIYSLGVVGYEVLTGKGPYPDRPLPKIAADKLREPPTPLVSLLPDVDPELAALLERCLEKKPERRPTAAEVVAALDAMDADEPVRAEMPSVPQTPFDVFLGELKRRRVYRVAVGYAAVALAAIGGLSDVFESLELSSTLANVAIVLILAGFPITLVLTWMFDVRRGKITRTTDTSSESGPRLSRVLPMVALVASLLFAAAGVWWVLSR